MVLAVAPGVARVRRCRQLRRGWRRPPRAAGAARASAPPRGERHGGMRWGERVLTGRLPCRPPPRARRRGSAVGGSCPAEGAAAVGDGFAAGEAASEGRACPRTLPRGEPPPKTQGGGPPPPPPRRPPPLQRARGWHTATLSRGAALGDAMVGGAKVGRAAAPTVGPRPLAHGGHAAVFLGVAGSRGRGGSRGGGSGGCCSGGSGGGVGHRDRRGDRGEGTVGTPLWRRTGARPRTSVSGGWRGCSRSPFPLFSGAFLGVVWPSQ